jgi:two-component system, cell cycle sensor histidine kinase and response regulator CckA
MTGDRSGSAAEDPTAALRRSEQRYRELFESHPVAMAVWDPATHHILAANDAALRQYGYRADEIVGLSIEQLVHPADLPRLLAAVPRFSHGLDGAASFRHVRRDGAILEVEVTGHEIDWGGRPARVVMALDVTGRRQLEQQLRQAQKMEAIGRLAGGIAHDFNNLLTAIGGYTRLLVDSFEPDDPRREDAEQIRIATERAATLTGQLLAFSRGGMAQAARLDLNAVVAEIEPLLRRTIGEQISVETAFRATVPWVMADRSQLEQMLVSLALNARDAMPDGGTLRIETEDLEARAAWRQGLDTQAHVQLIVSDTGVGIADDVRDQVFEPFFSREGKRGSGLGLATVYATVRQAGGRIRLASEPGRGSVFRILLPVASEATGPAAAGETVQGEARTANVLLVEDESAVRDYVARVLRGAGHRVVVANDGESGLTVATRTAEPFDVLLSDVVMPGMGGLTLARELKARYPSIRVLLVSGYTDEASDAAEAGFDLLPKPFTADELLARVQRALGTPTG